MQRTATYWPPGSWEPSDLAPGCRNLAVQVQATWVIDEGCGVEVYLLADVAEGGYLYDGVSYEADPRKVEGARKIDLFLAHPDVRTLKKVRKAIVS